MIGTNPIDAEVATMPTQRDPSTSRNAEDIERAAWFARLALGDSSACPAPRSDSNRRKRTRFHVLR